MAGHQHRLVCGCVVLAGGYCPVEIRYCPTHREAEAMLKALKGISDAVAGCGDHRAFPAALLAVREVIARAEAKHRLSPSDAVLQHGVAPREMRISADETGNGIEPCRICGGVEPDDAGNCKACWNPEKIKRARKAGAR